MSSPKRPLGVTIIAAFWIVTSLLSLLVGVLAVILGGAATGLDLAPRLEPLVKIFGGIVLLIGIGTIILGILQLILSWGLISGKYWAWLIAAILEGIRILTSIFTLIQAPFFEALITFIHVITLIYLLMPHVRAYFRGKPRAYTYPVPPPPPTSQA